MTAGGRLIQTILAAALALTVVGCDGDDDGQETRPWDHAMLFRFQKFESAPRVDGGEVTLKSLETKVVLLELFGTWSPPCRRAAPFLVSIYERYWPQGFEIVGLAYERTNDPGQARQAVEAYAATFKVPYILALGSDVTWNELRRNAGARGVVPTIVLMDRQGVVRDVFEGLLPGHEAVLADRIERLLAEPAVAVPMPGD